MAESTNDLPPAYDDGKSLLQPSAQQYPAPTYQQQAPPAAGVNTTYVIASQPATVTVVAANFGVAVGDYPVQTTCPNCRNMIVTDVTREIGGFCWFIAAMLCIFGCFLCSWIPFLVDSCHDAVHTCPSCKAVIGRFRRL